MIPSRSRSADKAYVPPTPALPGGRAHLGQVPSSASPLEEADDSPIKKFNDQLKHSLRLLGSDRLVGGNSLDTTTHPSLRSTLALSRNLKIQLSEDAARRISFYKSCEKMEEASVRREECIQLRRVPSRVGAWAKVLAAVIGAKKLHVAVLYRIVLLRLKQSLGPMMQRLLRKFQLQRSRRKLMELSPGVDAFQSVALLSGWPKFAVKELATFLLPRVYDANQHIYFQGEIGFDTYYISYGKVELLVSSVNASEGRHSQVGPSVPTKKMGKFVGDTVIATLEDGALFGESVLLGEEPRSESAFCVQPTLLWKITTQDFARCMDLLDAATQRETRELAQSRRKEVFLKYFQLSVRMLRNQSSLDMRSWDPELMLSPLVPKFTPKICAMGEKVYAKGDQAFSVYYIVRGRVSVGNDIYPKSDAFRIFGEVECLLRSFRCEDASCLAPTEMWCVDRASLFEVLQLRPKLLLSIKEDAALKRSESMSRCPRNLFAHTITVLRSMPKVKFDALYSKLVPRYYEQRAVAIRKGEACNALVIVGQGALRSLSMEGTKAGEVLLGPGHVFGGWELFHTMKWQDTFVTTCPTEVYFLSRNDYFEVYNELPQDLKEVIAKACGRERSRLVDGMAEEKSEKIRISSPVTVSTRRHRGSKVCAAAITGPQKVLTPVSPTTDEIDSMSNIPDLWVPPVVVKESIVPIRTELESILETQLMYRSTQQVTYDSMGLRVRRPQTTAVNSNCRARLLHSAPVLRKADVGTRPLPKESPPPTRRMATMVPQDLLWDASTGPTKGVDVRVGHLKPPPCKPKIHCLSEVSSRLRKGCAETPSIKVAAPPRFRSHFVYYREKIRQMASGEGNV